MNNKFDSIFDMLYDGLFNTPSYEKMLDDMWANYCTENDKLIVDYHTQVSLLKEDGYTVMRNGKGKHKLLPKE